MEERNKNIIIGIVISVLLIAIGSIMIYDRYRTKAIQTSFEQPLNDYNAYIQELEQIENQLKVLKEAINKNEKKTIVVSYDINDASDLEYIKKQEEKYKNKPVIVIDCHKSKDELQSIFDVLNHESYTVMLTESDFNVSDIQKTQEILKNYKINISSLFLSRRIDINSSESQELKKLGFKGYTVLTYNFDAGYEKGMIYCQYTYLLKTNDNLEKRMEMMTVINKPSIVTISLKNRNQKLLDDQTIDSLFKSIQKKVNKKEISYGTLDDIYNYLSGKVLSKEDKQKAYDDYQKATKNRILELKEIIDN